jgi:rhodanese-related sulfurtransferase
MFFFRSKSLALDDAAAAMARGELRLIDVRGSGEVAAARVQDAIHIPLDQLSTRLDELDSDRRVAFVCRSGRRNAMATRAATKAGLDATNVKGGLIAWERAGLPLNSKGSR